MRRTALMITMGLLLTACTSEEATSVSTTTTPVGDPITTVVAADPRTPVLLDYSPTVSDLGALAFVAMHPDLNLIGVTLPGTGESYCEPGVAHTRGVLVDLGLGDVPVACGPDEPLTGWNAFPTSWRIGSNEMDLPVAVANDTRSAPQLLADLIRDSDSPVRILAVAPLTNLALMLRDHHDAMGNVNDITIMGGAVDVPGNVTRNDVGEWNIWVDPTAAGVVLASGLPVTLVPLDATNYLPSNAMFFNALDGSAARPAATLVRDAISDNPFWLGGEGFFFWDELAAAVLVEETLVTFENRRLVVDDETRENKGWTREDQSGAVVRVAVTADRRAFEQIYLNTLVGEHVELGYLAPTAAEVAYLHELERIEMEASAVQDEIFESTLAALGVDESDDAFLAVVLAALPEILSGPWFDRIDAMEAMVVPDVFADSHRRWIDGLQALAAAESDIVAAIELDGFDAIAQLFDPISEACVAMTEAAEIRLVAVEFNC